MFRFGAACSGLLLHRAAGVGGGRMTPELFDLKQRLRDIRHGVVVHQRVPSDALLAHLQQSLRNLHLTAATEVDVGMLVNLVHGLSHTETPLSSPLAVHAVCHARRMLQSNTGRSLAVLLATCYAARGELAQELVPLASRAVSTLDGPGLVSVALRLQAMGVRRADLWVAVGDHAVPLLPSLRGPQVVLLTTALVQARVHLPRLVAAVERSVVTNPELYAPADLERLVRVFRGGALPVAALQLALERNHNGGGPSTQAETDAAGGVSAAVSGSGRRGVELTLPQSRRFPAPRAGPTAQAASLADREMFVRRVMDAVPGVALAEALLLLRSLAAKDLRPAEAVAALCRRAEGLLGQCPPAPFSRQLRCDWCLHLAALTWMGPDGPARTAAVAVLDRLLTLEATDEVTLTGNGSTGPVACDALSLDLRAACAALALEPALVVSRLPAALVAGLATAVSFGVLSERASVSGSAIGQTMGRPRAATEAVVCAMELLHAAGRGDILSTRAAALGPAIADLPPVFVGRLVAVAEHYPAAPIMAPVLRAAHSASTSLGTLPLQTSFGLLRCLAATGERHAPLVLALLQQTQLHLAHALSPANTAAFTAAASDVVGIAAAMADQTVGAAARMFVIAVGTQVCARGPGLGPLLELLGAVARLLTTPVCAAGHNQRRERERAPGDAAAATTLMRLGGASSTKQRGPGPEELRIAADVTRRLRPLVPDMTAPQLAAAAHALRLFRDVPALRVAFDGAAKVQGIAFAPAAVAKGVLARAAETAKDMSAAEAVPVLELAQAVALDSDDIATIGAAFTKCILSGMQTADLATAGRAARCLHALLGHTPPAVAQALWRVVLDAPQAPTAEQLADALTIAPSPPAARAAIAAKATEAMLVSSEAAARALAAALTKAGFAAPADAFAAPDDTSAASPSPAAAALSPSAAMSAMEATVRMQQDISAAGTTDDILRLVGLGRYVAREAEGSSTRNKKDSRGGGGGDDFDFDDDGDYDDFSVESSARTRPKKGGVIESPRGPAGKKTRLRRK